MFKSVFVGGIKSVAGASVAEGENVVTQLRDKIGNLIKTSDGNPIPVVVKIVEIVSNESVLVEYPDDNKLLVSKDCLEPVLVHPDSHPKGYIIVNDKKIPLNGGCLVVIKHDIFTSKFYNENFYQKMVENAYGVNVDDQVVPLTHPGCKKLGCVGRWCYKGIRSAGVLPVDTNSGQIYLVKDQRGTYSDPGGEFSSEHGDDRGTAVQEAHEETRMQTPVDRDLLDNSKYVDINPNHKHRCFLLHVNGHGQVQMSCTKFYNTDVSHLSYCYQETTAMTKFHINSLKSYFTNNGNLRRNAKMVGSNQVCEWLDDKGIGRPVGGRIVKVMEQFLGQGLL